jgi:hypothetical protein
MKPMDDIANFVLNEREPVRTFLGRTYKGSFRLYAARERQPDPYYVIGWGSIPQAGIAQLSIGPITIDLEWPIRIA